MEIQKRKLRIIITYVGLQTIAASAMPIYGGITQLRAWRHDPLSDASVVVLMLGILMAIGGIGGVALLRCGIKYQDHVD
jgi:hypothetical protein